MYFITHEYSPYTYPTQTVNSNTFRFIYNMEWNVVEHIFLLFIIYIFICIVDLIRRIEQQCVFSSMLSLYTITSTSVAMLYQ